MIDLRAIALDLVSNGKGLLAIDETIPHADKWLASHGIAGGEEMRREFRELFFTTPGIEQYVAGVIMYEETLGQKTESGETFSSYLSTHGVMPGIKVDQGLEPFPGSPEETITNGLLGLPERLAHFHETFGTSFTKWRAAITIKGTQLPTAQAMHENAKRLAMYALDVQKANMVPIVEPEVLITGDHSRLRAREVMHDMLTLLVAALEDCGVDMGAVILKTSMAISGDQSGKNDTPEEVAHDTVDVLMETIPPALPGIVFLSGGQSTDSATKNLAAITAYAKEKNAPWPLTFSYARALQDEALTAWGGKPENLPAARAAFLARLQKEQDALR